MALAPMTTKQIILRPMPDLADYMTTEDAAKRLGFHIDHIRRMLRGGDLEGLKLRREWLVSRKSVDKYLKATEGMDKQDPRRGNK
jgi:excisionase family DNA binding protein